MNFGCASFPPLTPRISQLYGANRSTFRVGEARAYAQDLDELEQEERALENMVHELVNRQAAVPIGVKFHREGASIVAKLASTDASTLDDEKAPTDSDVAQSSSSEEEDMCEDEMTDDDAADGTTGRATIGRGEAHERDNDSFTHSRDSEDDLMETN